MSYTFHEFPHTRNYDSDLRELIQIVREMDEYLASLETTIEQLEEALKDIPNMQNAIKVSQQITADLPTIRSGIQTLKDADVLFAGQIAGLNGRLDVIDLKFDLVYEYIDKADYLLLLKMNQYKIELQNQIDALREALAQIDTNTVNPWHEELGKIPLQKNIQLMYMDLADRVPLAMEYSELGLTADEYASLELSAYEYAVRGDKHLHLHWVFSPVYGWKQEISNVLTSIVNAVFGTLSASDYSALDMTADEYASMDMTSEDYQRYNPTATSGYLRVSPSGTGLTKTQYEHIELV